MSTKNVREDGLPKGWGSTVIYLENDALETLSIRRVPGGWLVKSTEVMPGDPPSTHHAMCFVPDGHQGTG